MTSTTAAASHAVIAAYRYGHCRDWTGRYLHDVPSIADVAVKLCQIVRQRYQADAARTAQQMLDWHPRRLARHLHRLDRQSQTALLRAAADRLHPDRHQSGHSEEL